MRNWWPLRALVGGTLLAVACHQTPPAGQAGPGGVAAAAARAAPRAPSSIDNILAAEKAGKLDHDTSLVYQLYALHAPDRLPPGFVGTRSRGIGSTSLFREVAGRRKAMRADLQAAVEPFFHRPTEPESFWAKTGAGAAPAAQDEKRHAEAHDRLAKSATDVPPSQWSTVDTSDGNIRIWYQHGGGPKATALAQALVTGDSAGSAWTAEQHAMGRVPCSDAKLMGQASDGSYINGATSAEDPGAGRLDVYLMAEGQTVARSTMAGATVEGTDTGVTVPQHPGTSGCQGWSSFSLVDVSTVQAKLPSVVAHEMFHDFQNAFLSDITHDSKWLSEATAAWAEDYVFPRVNSEWDYLNPRPSETDRTPRSPSDWQGKATDGPLTDYDPPTRGYAAYIFPFFLTRVASLDATTMGTIYKNVASLPNGDSDPDLGLAALTGALGGADGFRKQFKQFALANWNADCDAARLYQDYDATGAMNPMSPDLIWQSPGSPTVVTKPGEDENQMPPITVNLPATEVQYIPIDVDNSHYVPRLFLDLSGLAGNQDVSVQAIERIDGQAPKVEDLTGQQSKDFCRDQADQKIVSMVLIVANAATDASKTLNTTIRGRAENACAPTKGNFTYSAQVTIQHGQNASCAQQRQQMDKSMTVSTDAMSMSRKTTVNGTISASENVTSQWQLTPVEDITDPVKKLRTVIYEIDSGNNIHLSETARWEERTQTTGHVSLPPPLSSVNSTGDDDETVSVNNQASGTSCNGPAPQPGAGQQGPSWSCKPGWTPPPGRNEGRDGQAGSLTLHMPQGGQATYEIHWNTADVDVQASCDFVHNTVNSSSDGKGNVNNHATEHYDQSSNSMLYASNGHTSTSKRSRPPGAYSGNAMSHPEKFWRGNFSSGGDIDVSDSRSSSDCSDGGLYIGLEAPVCANYTQPGQCDSCTFSSSIHLHIHVDVPQATPQAPAPQLPPNATSCDTLAACCPAMLTLPGGAQLVGVCTQVSGMGMQSACSQTLTMFKGKNLCP